MNNYYEFTKYEEDGMTLAIFNGLSNDKLKSILDDYFNEIECFLDTFTNIFNESNYDEFYYKSKSLIEQINDIKIIINILKGRDMDE